MKAKALVSLILLLGGLGSLTEAASLGTAFTYQGRLTDGTSPASGSYDLRFAVYDDSSGPGVVAGPVTNAPVTVSNGLFTTTLDFGSSVFTGDARWLEIAVRTNGSSTFTCLSPRQPLTPSPYALYAPNAGTAATATTATAVAANGVASASLQTNAVNGDKIDNGTIEPEDLNGASFSTVFWKANGNSGTTPGPHFLGTTDNQALELKVDFMRALRLEPNEGAAPNIVAGSRVNFVAPSVVGATIGGGGAVDWLGAAFTNRIAGHFGTVGGGAANGIGTNSDFSTIGGGSYNQIADGSLRATIAGGYANNIGTNSPNSTIGGGYGNTIADYAFHATIGGGEINDIGPGAFFSAIGGGGVNNIAANSLYATIAGGTLNALGTNSNASAIAGGRDNTIGANSSASAIGGGEGNSIADDSIYATIAGGRWNDIGTNSNSSVIGGGEDNSIAAVSRSTTIAGGRWNDIGTYSSESVIAGGYDNAIGANSYYAAIGGGSGNEVGDDSPSVTIAGGNSIRIGTNSDYSAIGGGAFNRIGANSWGATIAGGGGNNLGAYAKYGVIGGGFQNTIGTNAQFAVIPGGCSAVASHYAQQAFASGFFAVPGDAQTSLYVVWTQTTNALFNELFLDGTSQRLTVPTNSIWTFDILVSAAGIGGNAAGYQIRGVIKNRSGATAFVGTPTVSELGEDVSGWETEVAADNDFDALLVRVRGADGVAIRWVASVRTVEVIH
jgi:hypothetical protein